VPRAPDAFAALQCQVSAAKMLGVCNTLCQGPRLVPPEHGVRFRLDRVQLFPQRTVSLHGIPSDLLISLRRHAGEIPNMRRQTRLSISNRLIVDARENRLDFLQRVSLRTGISRMRTLCAYCSRRSAIVMPSAATRGSTSSRHGAGVFFPPAVMVI
jgi:hypothetical protein